MQEKTRLNFKERPQSSKGVRTDMDKLRNSNLIKGLCYVLVPILFLALCISFFHLALVEQNASGIDESYYMGTRFKINQDVYYFMMSHTELPIYVASLSGIFLPILVVYLLWAIGHKEGTEEIELNSIDKSPYELVSLVCWGFVMVSMIIAMNMFNVTYIGAFIVLMVLYIICYVFCCIWGVTTVKRIKARKFWKSFLLYRICRWFVNKVRETFNKLADMQSTSKKIFLLYWGYLAISVILILLMQSLIIFLLLIAFWVWAYVKIINYEKGQNDIKEALKKIYNGDTDVHLDEKELRGTLKEMSIYINDIAGGFSNAIEQSVKSERLKAELITNVSHDIKTPLTSIINYVDLLKRENIQDEKVQEYIEILDAKSQRLKKLTEDLIEASKASSGNIKLNIEEISVNELISQSVGEFEDKFKQKNLQIDTNISNENLRIKADSRYVYRVIENLFGNIAKYALDNSRVYIDVLEKKDTIEISFKNISKERLNISSDELMQRFVRGDKSRYTEGSGLRTINSQKSNRVTGWKVQCRN